jgi:hypothetical protein
VNIKNLDLSAPNGTQQGNGIELGSNNVNVLVDNVIIKNRYMGIGMGYYTYTLSGFTLQNSVLSGNYTALSMTNLYNTNYKLFNNAFNNNYNAISLGNIV